VHQYSCHTVLQVPIRWRCTWRQSRQIHRECLNCARKLRGIGDWSSIGAGSDAGENCLKKASEVCHLIEPTDCHVRSPSYNCSATAKGIGTRVQIPCQWIRLGGQKKMSTFPLKVHVLGVPSDRNSRCGVDPRIDWINGSERVNINLQVGSALSEHGWEGG